MSVLRPHYSNCPFPTDNQGEKNSQKNQNFKAKSNQQWGSRAATTGSTTGVPSKTVKGPMFARDDEVLNHLADASPVIKVKSPLNILKLEQFLADHPDSIFKNQVLFIYLFIHIILLG